MRAAAFAVSLLVACGGAGTGGAAKSAAPGNAAKIRVEAGEPWKDAATAILGDACPDAVLVWGDVKTDDTLRPRAVDVSVDDAKPVLHGFLICNALMEPFLRMQTSNPRLEAGHGGTADLKWRDGQLFMRRRWSAADIPLGKLDPPPSDVFQRGETLAAIVSVEDPNAPAGEVLAAIARAPRVFLFAMFPLR